MTDNMTEQETPDWVDPEGNLAALLDRNSDMEVVETIRKDSMDPAGTYVSTPDEYPLTSSVENYKGRLVVTLSGLVTLVKPRDKSFKMPDHPVRTRLTFFKLSPDRRNKLIYGENNKPLLNEDGTPQDTGAPDAQTLRWVEARDAFRQVYGEEAKKDSDILTFLTEYPIQLVMFQGSKGLGVSKVFAKK